MTLGSGSPIFPKARKPHAYIRRVSNPQPYPESPLAEYNDEAGRRMREQFKRTFSHIDDASILEVARRITRDSGQASRFAHYAEALQYASAGGGNAHMGLIEVTKDTEPYYRGGGPSPAAKRAAHLLTV